ncbi:MAG: hypothetical protein A3K03_03725 [Bdellovibrionales bacterium RIFOXYD1_FULL_44_7]|nr:MAG: hypothetical protein A3K03_03725 [Bdellovibrionales bacterium RIFOXYD1_FULL_44_7]
MSQKVPKQVLAYDLGGTKVAVGIIDENGAVIEEVREPVVIEKGKTAVINQLARLGQTLLKDYPNIKKIGVASAGPLHAGAGTLLDPTNFTSKFGTWGKTPIAPLLSKKLKMDVFLENDAAAAILAEKWIGAAKKISNAMILTLGTGLGTGIITNGELTLSGRGLHPEAGHIVINYDDPSAVCGCGNIGCAEAFLSGNGFTKRVSRRFSEKGLTAEEIAHRARNKDPVALAAFNEYAELMAVTLGNYIAVYAPEIVIFTGSFAATSDLFLEKTRKLLKSRLTRRCRAIDLLPKLVLSKLHNKAGLIGAGYVAFTRKK